MVPIGVIACDACGNQPPAHISCPAKAAKGSGKGTAKGGGKGGGNRGNGVGDKATTLEKQLKAELEASKQELAKLKRQAATETNRAKAGDVADAPLQASDEAPPNEASRLALEVQGEIKDLKGDLQFFASLPEERRNRILGGKIGYDSYVIETKAKLELCFKKQQGARTLKQQLASAQGMELRMEKAAAADDAALASLQEQLVELQGEIAAQVEKASKSKAELVTAAAEVKRLAAAMATEGSQPCRLPESQAAWAGTDTAQMSAEQLQARSRGMQADIDKFHEEANERWNAIQAVQAQLDADIDIDSEAESVAPSETGSEDPKAKRLREKVRTKRKLAEKFGKIASKFAKPVHE